MAPSLVSLLLLIIFFIINSSCEIVSIKKDVDVFIGTGGEGFGIGSVPPGPQRPFGPVRVGPDTCEWDDFFLRWDHFGGYYYGDSEIRCFSHIHMVGSGALDYGNIGVMPSSSEPDSYLLKNHNYRSSFSHSKEVAWPGYYSVFLEDPQVLVELSSTKHVGAHRYSYFKEDLKLGFVLFPISHALAADACLDSYVSIDPTSSSVEGWILNGGSLSKRFGGVKIFFFAQFSIDFNIFGTWSENTVAKQQHSINGTNVGAYIGIQLEKTENKTVEFFVGVSFISCKQAKNNFLLQVAKENLTFDHTVKESERVWEEELGKVVVNGGTSNDRKKFYTALYHTFLAPTAWSEADGTYVGFDRKVHQLDQGSQAYYTDMSIWDTHRSEFPWLALSQPDVMRDIVRSLVDMLKQGGDLPRWPLANCYTGCMIGQHASVIITDAFRKGIVDFDVQSAYSGMRLGATEPRPNNERTGLKEWLTLGYIPNDVSEDGCSLTLAYSYDDWAVGSLAAALGYSEDSKMFLQRSQNYRNVWNDKEKFFCTKSSQSQWDCPDIYVNVFDKSYVEGDAWHWRWFVPHDVEGLIGLFGSNSSFVEELTTFFERSEWDPFNILPNPYYWAGNEPDILAVWLFDVAGRPDLTQKYSRRVLESRFTTQSDGLPGNDDYGTMSAWCVFAHLGLYPFSGSPKYAIGSPVFDSVVLIPTNTTIQSFNSSPGNVYVKKLVINGMESRDYFVEHSDLKDGILQFWMGSSP